jgi:hypothetical protein
MNKPIKSKPVFFACILPDMQAIAVKHGYNLVPHGSFARDFDIICIAWEDKVSSHCDLILDLVKFLGAFEFIDKDGNPSYNHSVLSGGRDSYVITFNHGYNSLGSRTEDIWYLDISFTPQVKESS